MSLATRGSGNEAFGSMRQPVASIAGALKRGSYAGIARAGSSVLNQPSGAATWKAGQLPSLMTEEDCPNTGPWHRGVDGGPKITECSTHIWPAVAFISNAAADAAPSCPGPPTVAALPPLPCSPGVTMPSASVEKAT